MKDLLLTSDFDIQFDTNGDFLMTEGFDTAILMSILCEKRADVSEVSKPEYRRGDWSDMFGEVGSKFWLTYQSRATNLTANKAKAYIQDGLNWLIEDEYLTNITVDVSAVESGLIIKIILVRFNGETESKLYNSWELTGL